MLNELQSLKHWRNYMGNPTVTKLGALTNGTIFGNILAFVVAPYVGDKFGRRTAIVSGQSIIIIGSVLQSASTNYALVSSPALVSEIAYPTHRHITTTFFNTCWYLGAVIAAWIPFGTSAIDNDYSWRIPSYLQGSLAVVQISLFWMIPESPRYLINKGRVEEAEAILMKHHIGNVQYPDSIIKFGRRTLFLTSISLMLVNYIVWTILSAINQQRNFEEKSLGNGVLAMLFFYYLSYNISVN